MSLETQAIQHFYDAVNRNDILTSTKDFDPHIVRVEPEGFPTAGTYRGLHDVQEHVAKGRGTWAEGTCQLEELFVNGDHVVAYVYAWVRLKDATDWIGGRFADGFVFRSGKIVQYFSFGQRSEALAWAGIEGPQAVSSAANS